MWMKFGELLFSLSCTLPSLRFVSLPQPTVWERSRDTYSMAAVSLHLTSLTVPKSTSIECRWRKSCSSSARCSSVAHCSVSRLCSRSIRQEYVSRTGVNGSSRKQVVRAVIDEAVDTEAVGTEAVEGEELTSSAESLSMYFKAEGALVESAVPKVTKALESAEGVSNVKVYISEGGGTVELTKQTSIQATGVASSLVEIIEQAGFKMHALSLGFDEDDADDDEDIEYDTSTYVEEEENVATA